MRTVLFADDEQSILTAIERMYLERDDFDRTIEILHETTETHFDRTLIELIMPIAEEVRSNG